MLPVPQDRVSFNNKRLSNLANPVESFDAVNLVSLGNNLPQDASFICAYQFAPDVTVIPAPNAFIRLRMSDPTIETFAQFDHETDPVGVTGFVYKGDLPITALISFQANILLSIPTESSPISLGLYRLAGSGGAVVDTIRITIVTVQNLSSDTYTLRGTLRLNPGDKLYVAGSCHQAATFTTSNVVWSISATYSPNIALGQLGTRTVPLPAMEWVRPLIPTFQIWFWRFLMLASNRIQYDGLTPADAYFCFNTNITSQTTVSGGLTIGVYRNGVLDPALSVLVSPIEFGSRFVVSIIGITRVMPKDIFEIWTRSDSTNSYGFDATNISFAVLQSAYGGFASIGRTITEITTPNSPHLLNVNFNNLYLNQFAITDEGNGIKYVGTSPITCLVTINAPFQYTTVSGNATITFVIYRNGAPDPLLINTRSFIGSARNIVTSFSAPIEVEPDDVFIIAAISNVPATLSVVNFNFSIVQIDIGTLTQGNISLEGAVSGYGNLNSVVATTLNTPLNRVPPPVGHVAMANNRIVQLAAPVSTNDAANKAYVDSKAAGGDVILEGAISASGPLGTSIVTTFLLPLNAVPAPVADVNMASRHIINLAAPEFPHQAANKAYVDSRPGGGGNVILTGDVTGNGPLASPIDTTITLPINRLPAPNGSLNMNNWWIYGVPLIPEFPNEVTSKSYVDSISHSLSLAQISRKNQNTEDVLMNMKRIQQLEEPVESNDAATKSYVDARIPALTQKSYGYISATTGISTLVFSPSPDRNNPAIRAPVTARGNLNLTFARNFTVPIITQSIGLAVSPNAANKPYVMRAYITFDLTTDTRVGFVSLQIGQPHPSVWGTSFIPVTGQGISLNGLGRYELTVEVTGILQTTQHAVWSEVYPVLVVVGNEVAVEIRPICVSLSVEEIV